MFIRVHPSLNRQFACIALNRRRLGKDPALLRSVLRLLRFLAAILSGPIPFIYLVYLVVPAPTFSSPVAGSPRRLLAMTI